MPDQPLPQPHDGNAAPDAVDDAAAEARAAAIAQASEVLARVARGVAATERLRLPSPALGDAQRRELFAAVRALRDAGLPPQRVIVLVKEAARAASRADPRLTATRREATDALVRGAIAAYYDET